MKLRKNEMISPKNFFVLHWKREKLHQRNSDSLGGGPLTGDTMASSGASVSSASSAPRNTTAPRESSLISNF